MKKLLFVISAVAMFASCTKEPGEIRGVVTCLSDPRTQEYRSDVGALVYVTKLNCDSLGLYYSGKMEFEDGVDPTIIVDSIAVDTSFIAPPSAAEIKRRAIKEKQQEAKHKKELEKFIARKSQFYSKFKKIASIVDSIKSSKETLKAQVDASGNYTITQVEPGDYIAIIFSSASTPSSVPTIEKIHVESKKTTTVNARFK
jgi:hypothetical protein